MPTGNKLNVLRAQIKAGLDALDRGDFVEVDDADLDRFLEGLTQPPIPDASVADPS
jgi:antitoxin ParD1/3/4